MSMSYYTTYSGNGEVGVSHLISRNYSNLFEAPVLFYAATVIIFTAGLVDETFLYLCWGYVFARVLHTLIHVFYNKVTIRFGMFAISSAMLTGIWIRLALMLF